MPRILLVNEADEVVGTADRYSKKPEEIFRAAHLWFTNSNGEILLAQRAAQKVWGANMWGPAAAGTLEEGETYESNIIKEAEEEIGLVIEPERLQKSFKMRFKTVGGSFNQFFTYKADAHIESFRLQEDEVQAVRWVTKEVLLEEITAYPERFVGNMPYWLFNFIPEAKALVPEKWYD